MIYLNKYDWKLNIVILTKYSNIEEILNYYLIPEKYKQKALTRLTQFYNSGIIYNDEYNKRSIIVIGECDSLFDLVNVFEHEKNHLELFLCSIFNIDINSEEASILSGDLTEIIFKSICSKFIS